MKTKEININEATPQQLRDFAMLEYGIELSGKENRNVVYGKLKAVGFTGDKILVPVDEPEPESIKKAPIGRQRVKINIHQTDEPGGQDPVKVSVNGKAMLIPRGEDVLVPVEYVEVLRNAKQSVPIQDRNGHITGYNDVLSYKFSKVG